MCVNKQYAQLSPEKKAYQAEAKKRSVIRLACSIEPSESKECNACHQNKTIDEFYKSKDRTDGYCCKCIECDLARKKEDYKNNTEKHKLANKAKRIRRQPQINEQFRTELLKIYHVEYDQEFGIH